jgi:hypothetical protein
MALLGKMKEGLLALSRHTANCSFTKTYGRGERIRTSDPLVPNQVLYQAEPLPELAIGRMLTNPKSPG